MFILMVGLLGVLAVLPFGAYQMNRVNKADFGGNCGRAAIQEIQVRGWAGNFEESLWDPYGNNRIAWCMAAPVANPSPNALEPLIRNDRPLLVDSLLLFENDNFFNNTGTQLPTFPASATNGLSGLPRLTSQFSGMTKNANGEILHPSNWDSRTLNQIRDSFYWQDDRNFAAPESPSVQVPRPVGVPRSSGGLQSHENYSWFYMLTPIARGNRYAITIGSGTMPNTYGVPPAGSPAPYSLESDVLGYDVDVVVFFNRNFDLDSLGKTERAVTARPDGNSGYRGGSFILEDASKENLDLTDTRWLLLSCPTADGTLFAKWYRIVSFGEIEGAGPFTRRVMLLGPDVPNNVSVSNATLVQGAIHVYSTVIKK